MILPTILIFFFFFNDPATTEISPFSLPDALPISPKSVIFLIAVFGWTYAARLVRGEFLALKEREFVMASRTIGARNFRLMFRHILPNAAGPIKIGRAHV